VQRQEDPDHGADRHAPALDARATAEGHAHDVDREPDQQQQADELHGDVDHLRARAERVQHPVDRCQHHECYRLWGADVQQFARGDPAGCRDPARP
jgi:hypothetical protein